MKKYICTFNESDMTKPLRKFDPVIPIISVNGTPIDQHLNYNVCMLVDNANFWWALTYQEKKTIYNFVLNNINLKLSYVRDSFYTLENLLDSLVRFCIPYEPYPELITNVDSNINDVKDKIIKAPNNKVAKYILAIFPYLIYSAVKDKLTFADPANIDKIAHTGANILPDNPNDVYNTYNCEEI